MAAVLCTACSDSSRRYEPEPDRTSPAPHVPTPEEELGIQPPGVLDAAVAAWARNNELGDYYEESQRRLEKARSKLLDDYRVRKGMDAAPTSFTQEWLKKYREHKANDDALRLHILECYSRGEVRPLPEKIRGVFTDSTERRRRDAELVGSAPRTLSSLEANLTECSGELDRIGSLSWETRKNQEEWTSVASSLLSLSERAGTLSADASGLSARLSRLASDKPEDDGLADLDRRASRLRRDISSLSLRVSDALGVAEGQTALASFAGECRRMEEWMRTLESRNEAKASRIAQEKEWRRRVLLARKAGNGTEIASAAAALPGFRSAMEKDKADGDIARKDVKAFKKYADGAAFSRFKQSLPPGARAGADALRDGVLRAIPSGRNPASYFETVESKAFKLHDDYEEKTAITAIESAINR